jgi:RimJ/RimL family protein N-acetyltransferase
MHPSDTIIFDSNATYILESDIVLLQPLQIADLVHLSPFALNEPELWKYALSSMADEQGMRYYLQSAINARQRGVAYPFIVWDKRSHQAAGSTRFYDIQLEHKCLSIGYTWYGKQFQGTGLNKHCKFLLLSFAFNNLRMERVEFRADSSNQRSIAAMKSIGCQVEGILRSNGIKADGTRRDSIVLSILKSEWENDLQETLKKKLATPK